jgi:hypothetical protein
MALMQAYVYTRKYLCLKTCMIVHERLIILPVPLEAWACAMRSQQVADTILKQFLMRVGIKYRPPKMVGYVTIDNPSKIFGGEGFQCTTCRIYVYMEPPANKLLV